MGGRDRATESHRLIGAGVLFYAAGDGTWVLQHVTEVSAIGLTLREVLLLFCLFELYVGVHVCAHE